MRPCTAPSAEAAGPRFVATAPSSSSASSVSSALSCRAPLSTNFSRRRFLAAQALASPTRHVVGSAASRLSTGDCNRGYRFGERERERADKESRRAKRDWFAVRFFPSLSTSSTSSSLFFFLILARCSSLRLVLARSSERALTRNSINNKKNAKSKQQALLLSLVPRASSSASALLRPPPPPLRRAKRPRPRARSSSPRPTSKPSSTRCVLTSWPTEATWSSSRSTAPSCGCDSKAPAARALHRRRR